MTYSNRFNSFTRFEDNLEFNISRFYIVLKNVQIGPSDEVSRCFVRSKRRSLGALQTEVMQPRKTHHIVCC
ncbi:hypothetical protein AHF37_03839 [Paragonimus kellicotti]|nr:hypothetical protein AHF37_03839 [Paragonimus kellicotti]